MEAANIPKHSCYLHIILLPESKLQKVYEG